jgi:GPH family glycoside/pentoside/hexuronide:cation symporter
MVSTPKLPVREKLAYGLGDFASNLVFATLSAFLMFYYTDIFGLSAAAVGTLLFVARAADAIWDLYLGTLVDRTRTRCGQCRPYLVFGAPVLAICTIATFTVPAGTDAYKLGYAYVTYTLLMVSYSLVNIPYSAMPALMTDDARDRTTLAAFRMFLAIFATLLVGAFTLRLVGFFGGEDKQLGYQTTVAVTAVTGMLLFWVCAAFTRERVPPVQQKKEVRQDLRVLVAGRAWWMMALMGLCVYTALTITSGSVLYYFKYVVGIEARASSYLAIAGLALLVGILISVQLTKRFCKRRVMMVAAAAAGILYAAFYFIDPKSVVQVFGLGFCIQVFNGITTPILWSMVADTADDAELRSGRRMVGLTTSSIAFAQKFGLGIGGAIAGMLLTLIGYQANVEQTPQAVHGLTVIMSWIPAFSKLLVVVILIFYPLGQRQLDLTQTALRQARLRPV